MALVGPDGNDMPEVMPDGVAAYDFVAIRSRVYTEYGREAFDPDFGIGLVHALGSQVIGEGEITRRFNRSLAGEVLGVDELTVQVAGNVYNIRLGLEV